jgi:hypothetical protein
MVHRPTAIAACPLPTPLIIIVISIVRCSPTGLAVCCAAQALMHPVIKVNSDRSTRPLLAKELARVTRRAEVPRGGGDDARIPSTEYNHHIG